MVRLRHFVTYLRIAFSQPALCVVLQFTPFDIDARSSRMENSTGNPIKFALLSDSGSIGAEAARYHQDRSELTYLVVVPSVMISQPISTNFD